MTPIIEGKKIYIIAGEASGDLHASNLVKSILSLRPDWQIRGWGGDLMAEAGVEIHKHINELAFMGFVEVVANLFTILQNFSSCKKDILEFKPDLVILVDYPGFNLRMAKWLHKKGIKIIYYISPQIWAWKENRVHLIRKIVDKMLVILPFEKDFYAKHQVEATYVGHPLLEAIENFRKTHTFSTTSASISERKKVVLLPGSRKQEILSLLPTMIEAANRFPEIDFTIAAAPSQELAWYEEILQLHGSGYQDHIVIEQGKTYALLSEADAALVCSGTATLETALFKVPQVVCYKANPISYQIAKRVIKVKYISLVNLILNKPFLTELIQKDFNAERLAKELGSLLDQSHQNYFSSTYNRLADLLQVDKYASDHAAEIVLDALRKPE